MARCASLWSNVKELPVSDHGEKGVMVSGCHKGPMLGDRAERAMMSTVSLPVPGGRVCWATEQHGMRCWLAARTAERREPNTP